MVWRRGTDCEALNGDTREMVLFLCVAYSQQNRHDERRRRERGCLRLREEGFLLS